MPQIAQIVETYASQIFWLLIVFGLIYFGIGRAMLPKIEATVDLRDKKIAGDLAAAEAARAQADATEGAYRQKIEAARSDSLKATQAAKAEAALEAEKRVKATDAELDARMAAAQGRIGESRTAALSSIEEVAAEAAQDIVSRVAGLSVSREDAVQAARAALAN